MTHQCAKILDSLERMTTFLDMLDGNMGADLCKIATDGVTTTVQNESEPDGSPWPGLSPAYEEWKARHYSGPMGVLHGLMTNRSEMAGELDIAGDHATVTYGNSGDARDEADWFQKGDSGQNRPPRPFWGFSADSLTAVRDYLAQRLRDKVG